MKKLWILALMTLMMAFGVNAATTFVTPTDSSVIYADYVFNVTSTDFIENSTVNCSITGTSASTGGRLTEWLYNGTETNETDDFVNNTISTLNMTDAGDWTVTGTCYNTTGEGSVTITSITSITVDNTVPICTWNSALTSSETYKPTQQWSVTASNATSCTLQFGSNSILTMTEASDVCTYTGNEKTIPTTSYNLVTATTSDGRNLTNCYLESIRIDEGVPLKQVAAAIASGDFGKSAAPTTPSNNNNLIMIVIIGLVAFWFIRRK